MLIKTYFCFRSKSISFDNSRKDNKEIKMSEFRVKKITKDVTQTFFVDKNFLNS